MHVSNQFFVFELINYASHQSPSAPDLLLTENDEVIETESGVDLTTEG